MNRLHKDCTETINKLRKKDITIKIMVVAQMCEISQGRPLAVRVKTIIYVNLRTRNARPYKQNHTFIPAKYKPQEAAAPCGLQI